MPWKRVCPMDEKLRFVAYLLEGSRDMTYLCRSFGISRKTGYKWLHRYEQEGPAGLDERSRAPKNTPHKTPPEIEDLVISTRDKHSTWGAPKIHSLLLRDGTSNLPSPATIGRILARNGLVKSKPKGGLKAPKKELTQPKSPNDVWSADFKGDFVGACGTRNYPLTISDLHSRFILCCKGLKNTSFEGTKTVFTRVFKEYGLPTVVRTDNGVPFASVGYLSRLSVWWMDLGIRSELISPGRPHENGIHERMHRTLKEDAVRPKELTFRQQQKAFDEFIDTFNFYRPHAGIKNQTPSELYDPSEREMPAKIREPDYPSGFTVKRIGQRGDLYHKRKRWFVSHAFNGKFVGLELVGDDLWQIHYRNFKIAYLDTRLGRMFT